MPSGQIAQALECYGFAKMHPGKNNRAGKTRLDNQYLLAAKNVPGKYKMIVLGLLDVQTTWAKNKIGNCQNFIIKGGFSDSSVKYLSF